MKSKAIKFRCENNFLFQTSKSTAQLEQFDYKIANLLIEVTH